MTRTKLGRTMWMAAALLLSGGSVQALEVEVKGLHLCCGGCITAVKDALEEVKGVEKVKVDRGAGAATFATEDTKTIAAALSSLRTAGFAGKVTVDGKGTAFPGAVVAAGTKSKAFVIEGVHLCCRACTQGVVKALAKEKGIGQVECDQDAGTVKITSAGGVDLDVNVVLTTLEGAGFAGNLKPESK